MKKMINSVHLEGKLYEHDLAIKTVQNKESSNYGKEYIAGTLNLATDEDCLNIVKTHFTFVTEYTAKGSKNNTFTTLKSIIENGKTVVVNGKDGIAGGVNLIIYSFTAIEGNLTDSDWQYCIGVLKAYAKDNRLKNIIAYAEDPRLIERMKRLFKIGGFYIKEPIGD